MVRVRFKRVGRPHAPFYRLVAVDRQKARDSKPIEILGSFNPRKINKPDTVKVDRIRYWLSTGAQPTDSVRHALKSAGIWAQVKPGSASNS